MAENAVSRRACSISLQQKQRRVSARSYVAVAGEYVSIGIRQHHGQILAVSKMTAGGVKATRENGESGIGKKNISAYVVNMARGGGGIRRRGVNENQQQKRHRKRRQAYQRKWRRETRRKTRCTGGDGEADPRSV